MSRLRSVVFSPNPDGTHDITITFQSVQLRPDGQCRNWWMISHKRPIREFVDCGGVRIKPKLVVKLYCKVPEFSRRLLHRKQVYEAIQKRSPILMT